MLRLQNFTGMCYTLVSKLGLDKTSAKKKRQLISAIVITMVNHLKRLVVLPTQERSWKGLVGGKAILNSQSPINFA